ncbi:S8 family peptidase [Vitiosangium sp. GDMCC 1.1324]|uniref:S8 family peptidase n=1 Tax=Vitiosangium sp. (strain GDMCC 1.1324) TaxID=2138576 RepID=UPI000D3C9245|nr:S8 family peptidase [Vitiosangium sp. GDMCC 1.1324]PTL81812.1 peptidase S8 [Vitiosangium sp. GDMCC 1.1324]
MIRRFALLGMLGFTACTLTEEPPAPSTTGTVKGTLTPFRLQSTPTETVRSALLRDAGVRQRLSKSISAAVAAQQQQGVRRAELATSDSGDADAVPGDVIVRFEEAQLSEADALARVSLPGYRAVHKGYITEHLHLIGYEPVEMRAMKVQETADLARLVAKMSGVSYAEKNLRFHAFKTPNDPGYARQWHYPMMNLPAAWDITTGSSNVVIGVLDTGIVKHPDLDGRVVAGADMISDVSSAGDGNGRDTDPTDKGKDQPNGGSSWHGSHVAGTIGAVSNDNQGVAGVTWSGKLLPVRVLGSSGGSFADIAAGIQWAAGIDVAGLPHNNNPAQVINMSLGGQNSPSQALQEVIDAAMGKGVIIVVAAGNSNIEASKFSPCNQQNVICVGATRFNGKRASYSNYGSAVDVMATGGETAEDLNGDGKPDGVLSTIVDETNQPIWAYYQGTSMASPHVAGIVALMKSVYPGLTPAQAKQILKSTADTNSQCTEGCGAGLVNAQAAVREAQRVANGGTLPAEPPKLGVGSTQLSFTGSGTQQLAVRNVGGGTLRVTAAASGTKASALSFPKGNTLELAAYESKPLAVSVNTAGLSNGNYLAQVSLSGDNGNKTDVLVKFQVGAAQDKDAIVAFLYLDDNDEWKVDDGAIALVSSSGGYAYSLKLAPQTYYAIATIDEDGDNELFEDGERVGFWRDATTIESIPLAVDQTVGNISFALVPYQSDDEQPSTSVIGKPCTSSSQCGDGFCATNFPGGYCTRSCIAKDCPAGSKCEFTTDGTAAYCFATCTDVGMQGTCRTGYVCDDDDAGGGVCIPP